MDICLDTHPYSGTTTICEALWMGVPVITLKGERAASLVGASLLNQIGMPELIAKDRDEFVTIATELARDPARFRDLRSDMRQRLEKTPLRDELSFAREMEAVYREAWRRWCDKGPTGN